MLLASNQVFVFPNTLRTQNQRVFNENNMIKYANRHEKQSYVISYTTSGSDDGTLHHFRFLLAGYLFEITLTHMTVNNNNVYAHIVLQNITQGVENGSTRYIQQLYGIDNTENNFTGLWINHTPESDDTTHVNTNNGTIYSLQLVTSNGDIPPNSLLLQNIDGGTC